MKHPFYLVMEIGRPVEVRECLHLRTLLTKPTNTRMHLVSVSPHVEVGDGNNTLVADKLLLLTIGERSLEDTVAEGCIVDIYYSGRLPGPACEVMDVTDIEDRLDMGAVFATPEKAQEQLARDLNPWRDTRD